MLADFGNYQKHVTVENMRHHDTNTNCDHNTRVKRYYKPG